MGCSNRVGTEKPWNLGHFYGTSYFVNPLGEIFACASDDKDELLVAEFDLDLIQTVRNKWQFYRDRRPELYDEIVTL
jgi:N-carbamoylputrescine amidase